MEQTIQYLKNFSEWRNERAKAILKKGEPQVIDEFTYLVPSQNSDRKYHVTHIDSYSCDCKDFEMRCKSKGLYCKHIKAILLFEKVKTSYEVEQIKPAIELMIEKPLNDCCPQCNSKKIMKYGTRKTQTGDKQIFKCRECKKRFVLSPIKNIKGNAKLVCLAMDSYYRGLSYRDISQQFHNFYGLNISHVTIREWILRFSETIEKYSKNIKPQTQSNIWNADETLILTKRGKDKKNPNKEFDYVWNVMDNKTKFLLASVNSGRSRSNKDAENVFKEAWEQNGKMPNQIICDRNPAYQNGCRKVFRNHGHERKIKFTSIVGKRKEINNNAIESHHTHEKEFHKIRRGVKETQTYQDGFKVFHNFVRKNARQGLTPADKCGIGVQGNAWETILLNSIKYKNTCDLTAEEKMPITP